MVGLGNVLAIDDCLGKVLNQGGVVAVYWFLQYIATEKESNRSNVIDGLWIQ